MSIEKEPGRRAFEHYNNAGTNPGKDWRGNPVPDWKDLTDDVRVKWAATEKLIGRDRLEAFGAHRSDSSLVVAFGKALGRYGLECVAHNAPLPLRVLLECFEDELRRPLN